MCSGLKLDQEKKVTEKTADCIHDSCPSKKNCGTESSTARTDDKRGGEMALGTLVQVWMSPGRGWDNEDAGSVWN